MTIEEIQKEQVKTMNNNSKELAVNFIAIWLSEIALQMAQINKFGLDINKQRGES